MDNMFGFLRRNNSHAFILIRQLSGFTTLLMSWFQSQQETLEVVEQYKIHPTPTTYVICEILRIHEST